MMVEMVEEHLQVVAVAVAAVAGIAPVNLRILAF